MLKICRTLVDKDSDVKEKIWLNEEEEVLCSLAGGVKERDVIGSI
jgi:hypothetical protein